MKLKLKDTLNRCGRILSAAAVLSVPVTFAVVAAPMAEAQAVANAKMHGTVTDPTGAIIPGATIDIIGDSEMDQAARAELMTALLGNDRKLRGRQGTRMGEHDG